MNILKRVLLYISRKKVRNILLMAFLCILIVFMLMGVLISMQAYYQSAEFKSTMTSGFTVSVEIDETDNATTELIWNEEGRMAGLRYVNPVTIDEEFVKTIASVGEVDSYNAQVTHYSHTGLETKKGRAAQLADNMALYPPEMQERENTAEAIPMMNIMAQTVNVYGNTQSDLHDFFLNGALTLSEGRHITEDDEYKILISRQMAERNGVTIGDTAAFDLLQEEIEYLDYMDAAAGSIETEIVGIYDINFNFEESEYTYEKDIPENYIFMDLTGITDIIGFYSDDVSYEKIAYYVDDPENLDGAIAAVRQLDLPWRHLAVRRDDAAYQMVTDPLDDMGLFTSVLLFISVVTVFGVLFLIMHMTMRSRKKEVYIMRSLGIRKKDISKQIMLEHIIMAAVALVIAIIITAALAGSMGEMIERFVLPEVPDGERYVLEYDDKANGVLTPVTQTDADLSYVLSPINCLIVGGITFASVLISVYFPLKRLLLKPLCEIKL